MAGLGILLGFIVFVVISAFTGEYVTKSEPAAGCLPGFVAGLLVAWPFVKRGVVCRHSFLRPAPRRYKVPVKQAFALIRDVISESSYNFGDRWNVLTADVNSRRILASLRFSDEQSKVEGSLKNLHVQKQRLQRFIEMEIQLKETADDTTIVELSFEPKAEGANWFACDEMIRDMVGKIGESLGAEMPVEEVATKTRLSPPPWWLLGIGGLAILSLFSSIVRAIFK
ncbi:MAG: hypothetical protein K2Y39_02365 [Candidatus Obscuribacterales bacterium]|nr:hypothetical protein [Candidatus Obscuribacterales bacterium]